jgi:predicted  nucleic acid-binding Zn-ribbon protein
MEEAQAKEREIEEQQQQLAVWEERRRELEGKLGQEEDRIKDKRMRLYRIRNERELQALRHEIDLIKEGNARLEEEILTLLEQIEQGRAQLQELEEGAAASQTPAAVERVRCEEQAATLRAELQNCRKERDKIAAGIDARLRQQYERIFSRRGGVAVVEVRAGTCQGCHMHIPAQMCNEIQTGRSIFLCPHCSRILYWRQVQEEVHET